MKIILNLRMFADEHWINVFIDDGISGKLVTNASGQSVTKSVKNKTIHISLIYKDGYEWAGFISGHDTPVVPSSGSFKMPDNDVFICCRSKKKNLYMANEDVMLCINGNRISLKKNAVVDIGKNGMEIKVDTTNGGHELDISTFKPVIDNLVKSGVLVKI